MNSKNEKLKIKFMRIFEKKKSYDGLNICSLKYSFDGNNIYVLSSNHFYL
jgi:hypothetical protein